jgi:hypothetical protein
MKTLTKEELLKFKEHYDKIYYSLDELIYRVVYVKSKYRQFTFEIEYLGWEYDGETLNFSSSSFVKVFIILF